MAMKKLLVTNNVEASYWRIVGFNTSISGKMCQIFLVGYKDTQSRLQNKWLVSKNHLIRQDDFDKYINLDESGNYISRLYEYLKENVEEFKDSVDIFE